MLTILLFLFFFMFINANEQYHLGIINHHVQWRIHCPENNTRIITPPINDQPLISYQCPYGSYPLDIVPIEIDFTFVCREESRLLWIIVDIYQYADWLWSKNIEQMNISIKLNGEISIQNSKSETNMYKNRHIIIHAFYVPFETVESLVNKTIEIFIRINQCRFYIREDLTWNDVIQQKCNSIQSKTLQVQFAHCDFFPKLLPIDTNHELQVDVLEDNTTSIPDFHVILSIDEQQRPPPLPIETTTVARLPDYYLLFNEHSKHILSTLAILTRASNLMTYVFIFTIIIFIVLIIFFLYTLCYHYHSRARRKSSVLI